MSLDRGAFVWAEALSKMRCNNSEEFSDQMKYQGWDIADNSENMLMLYKKQA